MGSGEVTGLLRLWRQGDRTALDRIVALVYDELHRLAGRQLRGERAGQTLRPTELVSEAFLRLAGGAAPDPLDRAHFCAIAARTMRQILVDHARRRAAGKRGAGVGAVTLDEAVAATERPLHLLALDEALEALAGFDERMARAVELRYFAGMTHEEIGAVLGVHARTVTRELRLAEAWLSRRLKQAS